MPEALAALPAVEPRTLDIQGILGILPHRYPMLLVDRIDSLEPGVSAEGIKSVTVNEPFMAGHFPGYPIMPGVLIVDALAQVAGIMMRTAPAPALASVSAPPADRARPGVLAAIQKMRFLRPVLPGDRLRLQARHVKTFGSVHQVKVDAWVENVLVATGELTLSGAS
jgi:3-hydroxyacyl-[acyl-carrier-protein] dehydratase